MKKTHIMVIVLLIASANSYAQYQGNFILDLKGGIISHGSTAKGKLGTINNTEDPSVQFSAGFGYALSNKVHINAEIGYRGFNSFTFQARDMVLNPNVFYQLSNGGRLNLYAGVGLFGGLQFIQSKNKLIEVYNGEQIIYGASVTPKVQYLISDNIGVSGEYRIELQFNSISKYSHLLNLGIEYYF